MSHRLSTVRDADRIYVLAGGKVAEEGTHKELLARGGLYAELCRCQSEPAGLNGHRRPTLLESRL